MRYGTIVPARFLERPNRFIAYVELDGQREKVHVKNTGRCKELLVPGAVVFLEDNGHVPGRKTRYDLVTVQKGSRLINMDSQAPNKVAFEAFREGRIRLPGFDPEKMTLQREKTLGDSRFDLYLEQEGRKAYVEVKGVTLELAGICRFPDAPTERGIKHLKGLETIAAEGCTAVVLFVIQMEAVRYFEPNEERHKAFADALRHAASAGVQVLAYDCRVVPGTVELGNPVPVVL